MKASRFPVSARSIAETHSRNTDMLNSRLIFFAVLWLVVLTYAASSSRTSAAEKRRARVATFNVSLNRTQPGGLLQDLQNGDDQAHKVAEILRTAQPDIVLLNEFDYDPTLQSIEVFRNRYLQNERPGLPPLSLPHVYSGAVNTGVPSGMDLNGNGRTHEAADAFGFGQFSGQYGMVILSRWPIRKAAVRTFQKFLWKDLPNATAPIQPETGQPYYPAEAWNALRLSSKSHWDVPVDIDGKTLHVLASHPTPPAFDGPEDRNGCRNHDEIRFWAEYIRSAETPWLRDDQGRQGGLPEGASFVIVGDQNADPEDGGSHNHAIRQLLNHPSVNAAFIPSSAGGVQAAAIQQLANSRHSGSPAFDTSDFSDRVVGNLRVDYVLPDRNLTVLDGGVFWPEDGQPLADTIKCSDHRLVWLDLEWP